MYLLNQLFTRRFWAFYICIICLIQFIVYYVLIFFFLRDFSQFFSQLLKIWNGLIFLIMHYILWKYWWNIIFFFLLRRHEKYDLWINKILFENKVNLLFLFKIIIIYILFILIKTLLLCFFFYHLIFQLLFPVYKQLSVFLFYLIF